MEAESGVEVFRQLKLPVWPPWGINRFIIIIIMTSRTGTQLLICWPFFELPKIFSLASAPKLLSSSPEDKTVYMISSNGDIYQSYCFIQKKSARTCKSDKLQLMTCIVEPWRKRKRGKFQLPFLFSYISATAFAPHCALA